MKKPTDDDHSKQSDSTEIVTSVESLDTENEIATQKILRTDLPVHTIQIGTTVVTEVHLEAETTRVTATTVHEIKATGIADVVTAVNVITVPATEITVLGTVTSTSTTAIRMLETMTVIGIATENQDLSVHVVLHHTRERIITQKTNKAARS